MIRKLTILAIPTALAIGVFTGYKVANSNLVKLKEQYTNALLTQAKATQATISDYRSKLDDANSKPPTTITERVLVHADCVPATSDRPVGDGGAAARVELDRRIVQRLTELANDREQRYRDCSYRLKALQEIYSNDNSK